MTRRALSLLGLLALSGACAGDRETPASPEPDGGQGPDEADEGRRVTVAAVVQRDPPLAAQWRIAPGGARIAADGGRVGCGVWDVGSGLYLGRVAAEADGEDPCADWPTAAELRARGPERSSDGTLEASFGSARVDVREVASGELMRSIPLSSRGSRKGLDLSWAPGPEQKLAVLASDPPAVELWNIVSDAPPRAVDFAPKHQPTQGWLAWREDGLVAVTMHEALVTCSEDNYYSYCDYDEATGERLVTMGIGLSSFFWSDAGASGSTLVQRREPAHAQLSALEPVFDDQLRWLAFTELQPQPRSTPETRVWAIATSGEVDPAIGYHDLPSYDESLFGVGYSTYEGEWLSGATTQWVEREIQASYDPEAAPGTPPFAGRLSWTTLVTHPVPALRQQLVAEIVGGDMATGRQRVFAVGDELHSEYELCVGQQCERGKVVPEGCVGLAGASGDPLVLAACDRALALIELAPAGGEPQLRQRLAFRSNAVVRWGQAGWLALLERGTGELTVLDPGSGAVLLQRAGIADLPQVPLATEHNLLAVRTADAGFALLEPSEAGVVTRFELDEAVRAAAVSPAGDRLAVRAAGELRVYELESGEATRAWPDDGYERLAWRQDAAALLSGAGFPERVYDGDTGALLAEVPATRYDHAPENAIDPAWRWVNLGRGRFLRTLDFRVLELGPGWARLETGQFEGEPPYAQLSELRFRVADERDALPIYTRASLERWLRRPGLVEDFFAGRAIAAPTVPVAVLSRLADRLAAGGGGP